ncbi:hypothetical protein PAEPH01_1715 [Pancytospora epiphaga]|nr:hypothetical protein PAEPH01_1715 [Pancytospora epiphaga]
MKNIFFKGNRVFCIILHMSILLGSYSPLTIFILKRKLKERIFEMQKTKEYNSNITVPIKHFQKQISKEKVDNLFIDLTNKEYTISEDNDNKERNINNKVVEDEKYSMSSNPRPYNDSFNYSENMLPNKQQEIIKGKPLIVADEANTITESEDECCKKLLMIMGQKKIRNHYKTKMQKQHYKAPVKLYSNLMFLNEFLNFSSSNHTADSIRMRFSSEFLNLLSTGQLVQVLITLLSRDLELTSAERCELVERVFKHIGLYLEMNFNNDQIVSLVTALLMSDVPHCFKQVFSICKMWRVFTTEEQERMLEGVISNISQIDKTSEIYGKEILMKLYLFVLNRNAANSEMCEVLKECILKIYEDNELLIM